MSNLREEIIKLAREVPETRKHLVPLLKKSAKMFDRIEVEDKQAGVKLVIGLVNDGSWTVVMHDKNQRGRGGEILDQGRGLFKSRKVGLPRQIIKGIQEAQKELGGV